MDSKILDQSEMDLKENSPIQQPPELPFHSEIHLTENSQFSLSEYKCPLPSCNYIATSFHSLILHNNIHNGNRMYVCPSDKCNFQSTKRNKVVLHYQESHPSQSPINLNSILSIEDGAVTPGELVCKFEGCKYHTKRMSDLKYHYKIHSGLKDHHCPEADCDFASYRLSDLSYHLKLYHNQQTSNPMKRRISVCDSLMQDTKRVCLSKQICPIEGCPLVFDSYNHMCQHLYVHTGEKLFGCSVHNCKFTGSRPSSVREHAKSIHPTLLDVEVLKLPGPEPDSSGEFACDESGCNERFKTLLDYRIHLSQHRAIFKCSYPDCKYTAIRKSLIDTHMIIHDRLNFTCQHPNCFFQTNNRRLFDKHLKTHSQNQTLSISKDKDNLYHCSYENCSYSTIRKCNLKRHFDSHRDNNYIFTPKNEFKCTTDGCVFSTLSQSLYFSHMQEFHSNSIEIPVDSQKEMTCSYVNCQFKTHNLKNLVRHKIRMHGEEKTYKCPHCEDHFKVKGDVAEHILSHHPKQ